MHGDLNGARARFCIVIGGYTAGMSEVVTASFYTQSVILKTDFTGQPHQAKHTIVVEIRPESGSTVARNTLMYLHVVDGMPN